MKIALCQMANAGKRDSGCAEYFALRKREDIRCQPAD